ncbi:MAG: GIY-YIG nuclease family protein [Promethearchaeota archaeon]|nr:MAG: GIY-YIG nuclease family protein [Candidatus Lokiarchaeota archaeon]
MCAVYYVYILETKGKGKKKYYTGYTKNLYKRLEQHKSGRGAKFCKGKDVKLEYFESYMEQGNAMRRELEIKSLSHKEKKELIDKFQKS